jgi:uncharacterized protein YbjT (DUF2867 family)
MGFTVCVIGASGLVGRALVSQLCNDPDVESVHLILRRDFDGFGDSAKLISHIVDFEQMEQFTWPACDVMCCCLGTTIKVAGSQSAFRHVDFDYVVQSAKLARGAGAKRLLVVSAMGAERYSNIFYNRVKGEMEAAVESLDYDSVAIFRPSLLTGKRSEFRLGEFLGILLFRPFNFLIPRKYRMIPAHAVARTMVLSLRDELCGVVVIESYQMQSHR